MSMMHPQEVIKRKRDGLVLTENEIREFIQGVTARTVSDAQAAAFLMAVFLRGLDAGELSSLTQAMRFSGEVFDSEPLRTFVVDKHSTGGVGDKTSLLIAPILAAAGVAHRTVAGVPGICVPTISGRSLGHTGGTLDKLETIPGFDTQLTLARFEEVLRRCGASLIGQTPRLVPADRILYGLRDHTSTVESPYLITASIMSKKLAESLDALVLDVKVGTGAFMQREEDARLLAKLMVHTGNAAGTKTVALLTEMSEPLGRFSGNWVEVLECVDIMQGRRHPLSQDLIHLTNVLSGWMLHLAGHAGSPEEGYLVANKLLATGAAYKAWLEIVAAQGGDVGVFEHPESFHQPASKATLSAEDKGYVAAMDCTEVGWAVQRLGAGRARPGDAVSAHAGIEVHVKVGERVKPGQPLVTLFAEDDSLLDEPLRMLRTCYRVVAERPGDRSMVRDVIRS